ACGSWRDAVKAKCSLGLALLISHHRQFFPNNIWFTFPLPLQGTSRVDPQQLLLRAPKQHQHLLWLPLLAKRRPKRRKRAVNFPLFWETRANTPRFGNTTARLPRCVTRTVDISRWGTRTVDVPWCGMSMAKLPWHGTRMTAISRCGMRTENVLWLGKRRVNQQHFGKRMRNLHCFGKRMRNLPLLLKRTPKLPVLQDPGLNILTAAQPCSQRGAGSGA
ncbi:uncharacterized protein LOC111945098, partial [Cyanistes caeruleus]|uniref:uncharacterized protein LOC111945098 n=1 Tax=Cyanistes caeruleus TaxID=156563 RepID=UPI000CDB68D6